MDTVLKYSCFGYPPEGISMQKAYILGKDKQGYFIQNGEEKIAMELDFIKMLFSPKDKEWIDIKL